MERVEIKTEDLRRVMNLLIDHLEKDLNIKSIKLSKNMYWTCNIDEMFNIEYQPKTMDVGSLLDDCEFIKEILNGNNSVDAPSIMFWHLSPLMLYISKFISS